MSIRAMEQEIKNQILDLPRFASSLRRDHLKRIDPSRAVFTGSGDSQAAALFAQELSGNRAFGSDPYELLRSIEKVRGRSLVIISVSGKTRTNLELAKKARRIARDRIAITASPASLLAMECDDVLELTYRSNGILTSGTISFTACLLACAYLLGQLPRTIRMRGTTADIHDDLWALGRNRNGSFVFAGSGVNYALGLYGAAKVNEVLGQKAEAVYPEELAHAKLFSLNKQRDVVVCISNGNDRAGELHELLRSNGFQSLRLDASGIDQVNRSLKVAVYLQVLVATLAKKSGIRECEFVTQKKTVALSSSFIY